jgi:hypothetical protein
MIKHYIETLYPGFVFAEQSSHEIPERKRPNDLSNNCIGYRFFDREVIEENGEILKGEPKNYSPMTYIGKELTLEEVKATMPNEHILISNMEINGYKRVVVCRGMTLTPRDGDQVELPELLKSEKPGDL